MRALTALCAKLNYALMNIADNVSRLIHLLLDDKPTSYEMLSARLREARIVFHECVAMRIEGPLRIEMQSAPHGSFVEKQQIANWVNGDLRLLGLAVKCPNTGLDSTIGVDHGSNAAVGRFRLRPFEDSKRRTFSSVNVFPVELVPHFQRREPLAKNWTDDAQRRNTPRQHEL